VEGAQVSGADALAVDRQGNVYILDSEGVKKVSSSGVLLHTWTLADILGSAPAALKVFGLREVTADGSGNVYVVVWGGFGSDSTRKLAGIYRIPSDGGRPSLWRAGVSAVGGLTVDSQGNVYVVHFQDGTVTIVSPSGEAIGEWGVSSSSAGQFEFPSGIAVDPDGNVYVAGRSRTDKFSAAGEFLQSLGTPSDSVAVDGQGGVYTYSAYDGLVHKFDPNGTALLAFGQAGVGDRTRFDALSRLTVDRGGVVYVVESFAIWRFSAQGKQLGKWDSLSEGISTGQPTGVAVDASGNLYMARFEPGDPTADTIQKISPAGKPLAQLGQSGSAAGQLRLPRGLAVDQQGNLYVADTGNDRVQKMSPSGQPLAQWGEGGIGPGKFAYLSAVAVDSDGNVYAADLSNHNVQKLTLNPPLPR
jgi:sugar lactone lactonase YvrE